MIGSTLNDIRNLIESLASESGTYYLVCGRTHDRPVPATGLYFESRAVARAAVRATEQYRAVLRRYDPNVPYYDVIVCEEPPESPSPTEAERRSTDGIDEYGDRSSTRAQLADSRTMVDFCHVVAGAIFEAIASSTYTGLENAIMETYLDVAETIDSPDELCLRLLESIAAEFDARLDPEQQAAVLTAAAADLPVDSVRNTGERDPLEGTLAELRSVGLLDKYSIECSPANLDSETYSWTVQLDGYALGRTTERVVTVPIVVELFRRLSTRSLTITDAERTAESSPPSWQLRVATTSTSRSRGLAYVGDDPSA